MSLATSIFLTSTLLAKRAISSRVEAFSHRSSDWLLHHRQFQSPKEWAKQHQSVFIRLSFTRLMWKMSELASLWVHPTVQYWQDQSGKSNRRDWANSRQFIRLSSTQLPRQAISTAWTKVQAQTHHMNRAHSTVLHITNSASFSFCVCYASPPRFETTIPSIYWTVHCIF